MTPEYAVGLLGLVASICAVAALIWAVWRRLLRTDDQAMYEVISDDEPDFSAPPSTLPRRSRRLFGVIYTAVFVLIGVMIVQTVRVATRVPVHPAITQGLRPEK